MHRLYRPQQEPSCLCEFDYNHNSWDDVTSSQKDIIWDKLFTMQGQRCAYCEAGIPLKGEKRHIEHFRRKGIPQFKPLTFEWSNLFGSCSNGDRCGRYKDKQQYNDGDILKVDEENPEDFFIFLSSGGIKIREDLNDRDKFRAKETLRVFNLNPQSSGVKTERSLMISSYHYLAKQMVAMFDSYEEDEVLDIINDILDEHYSKIAGLPFETALRSFLFGYYESQLE